MTMGVRVDYMTEPVTGLSVVKSETMNVLVKVMYMDVADVKHTVEYSDSKLVSP